MKTKELQLADDIYLCPILRSCEKNREEDLHTKLYFSTLETNCDNNHQKYPACIHNFVFTVYPEHLIWVGAEQNVPFIISNAQPQLLQAGSAASVNDGPNPGWSRPQYRGADSLHYFRYCCKSHKSLLTNHLHRRLTCNHLKLAPEHGSLQKDRANLSKSDIVTSTVKSFTISRF